MIIARVHYGAVLMAWCNGIMAEIGHAIHTSAVEARFPVAALLKCEIVKSSLLPPTVSDNKQ